jgi:hypothetical protein
MAEKRKKSTTASRTRARQAKKSGKVGSDPRAVRKVGGKRDFGVPETGRERDRAYVSQETKANDPGAMPERSANPGNRVTGVGGNASGVGSSSGGDIDTDLIGVGAGGSGLAQSGPDRTSGPDIVEGDQSPSEAFASRQPPRAGGRNLKVDRNRKRPSNRREIIKGSTIDRSGGDVSTTDPGQGSAAVTNPRERDDDSFAGEINIDEASGMENAGSDRR